ncbi:ferritin-like protein [Aureisphaera galaxeae]|uniref:ferritin-like domain-containing protein n=1 Tax=Aureisphaera galaxeae TaxID=1538023 RepID=UPI002350861E|nr:ferritin-like protein [Aureisphaera galaxeae]MDC8004087.1 ferritin-like protein [Aureisphaera galaxeae]
MLDQKNLPYHERFVQPTAKEQKVEATLEKNKMLRSLMSVSLQQDTLADLHEHLRVAMMLELSTIPPYLCALYSIMKGDMTDPNYKEEYGDNAEAAALIRSVMMEEMLHFTLAGNILNAVGGEMKINHKEYVPEYPTVLPDSAGKFQVHLSKFDKAAIRTFLRIEQPTPPETKPKLEGYTTIGQFYHAIEELMKKLEKEAKKKKKTIFTGDRKLQIDDTYYYGGGGKILEVRNLTTALDAIEEILEQGEGSETTIYDNDDEFGQIRELAHYFKFNEIYEAQRYAHCQTDPKDPPEGTKMDIRYDKVYNMGIDPKTEDFVTDELKALSHEFNLEYRKLLDLLQSAFQGQQEDFLEAVGVMYKLRYKAVALMRNPIPGKRINAGPTFEFVEK